MFCYLLSCKNKTTFEKPFRMHMCNLYEHWQSMFNWCCENHATNAKPNQFFGLFKSFQKIIGIWNEVTWGFVEYTCNYHLAFPKPKYYAFKYSLSIFNEFWKIHGLKPQARRRKSQTTPKAIFHNRQRLTQHPSIFRLESSFFGWQLLCHFFGMVLIYPIMNNKWISVSFHGD